MKEEKMYNLLDRAQKTYGNANQITVVTEELCELASVLCKYPRFPQHEQAVEALRDKVIAEMADVLVCLGHVSMIFGIDGPEVDAAMDAKLERLERWLDKSDSQYQTIIDRDVRPVEPQGV